MSTRRNAEHTKEYADTPSYSAVRLLDPADESRVIGTISQAALLALARKPDRPVHVIPAARPKAAPRPSVAAIRTMVRRLKREPA